jgi:hypothetical protein
MSAFATCTVPKFICASSVIAESVQAEVKLPEAEKAQEKDNDDMTPTM